MDQAKAFDVQHELLHAISPLKIRELSDLYEFAKPVDQLGSLTETIGFDAFHSSLYDQHLIFSFDWMNWKDGRNKLNDASYSFENATFLELSMYLTVIFRSDHFIEGTIDHFYTIGTLDKIFAAMARFAFP